MLGPSILIVEDEAVVAEDLAQKVKALGYRVLDIASTGAAALQIDRSLNVWLSDLDKFECVSKEVAALIIAASRPARGRKMPNWLQVRENPNQLQLFKDF